MVTRCLSARGQEGEEFGLLRLLFRLLAPLFARPYLSEARAIIEEEKRTREEVTGEVLLADETERHHHREH